MRKRYKVETKRHPVLGSTPLAMSTILELDSIEPPLNVLIGETIKMGWEKVAAHQPYRVESNYCACYTCELRPLLKGVG